MISTAQACPRCGKIDPAEVHTCSPQYTQREAYLRGFADGAERLTHWINYLEKLLGSKGKYLIYDDYHGTITISYFDKHNFDTPLTHWMPLPVPPKDKKLPYRASGMLQV